MDRSRAMPSFPERSSHEFRVFNVDAEGQGRAAILPVLGIRAHRGFDVNFPAHDPGKLAQVELARDPIDAAQITDQFGSARSRHQGTHRTQVAELLQVRDGVLDDWRPFEPVGASGSLAVINGAFAAAVWGSRKAEQVHLGVNFTSAAQDVLILPPFTLRRYPVRLVNDGQVQL